MGETAVEETKKRGRPAKSEADKKRKASDEGGSEPKRSRGRPKGSKKSAAKAAPKKVKIFNNYLLTVKVILLLNILCRSYLDRWMRLNILFFYSEFEIHAQNVQTHYSY